MHQPCTLYYARHQWKEVHVALPQDRALIMQTVLYMASTKRNANAEHQGYNMQRCHRTMHQSCNLNYAWHHWKRSARSLATGPCTNHANCIIHGISEKKCKRRAPSLQYVALPPEHAPIMQSLLYTASVKSSACDLASGPCTNHAMKRSANAEHQVYNM